VVAKGVNKIGAVICCPKGNLMKLVIFGQNGTRQSIEDARTVSFLKECEGYRLFLQYI
jgi:hypothetical protein